MEKISKINSSFSFCFSESALAFPCLFEEFLFNEPRFISHSSPEGNYFFYVIRHKKFISARFAIKKSYDKAVSPHKASFGSIEFSDNLFPEIVREFIEFIVSTIKLLKISYCEIRSYPSCYQNENSNILTSLFLENKFLIKIADINQHINVSAIPFSNLISKDKRRRLLRSLKSYHFSIQNEFNMDEAYYMIKGNRDRKGFATSMTQQELNQMFNLFPKNYLLFNLKSNTKTIALAICIKINEAILYTFYLAHDPEYKKESPLVMTINGIYEYCQLNNFKILDLGTSSNQGVMNSGNYQFKKELGARTSLKYTFAANFSS